MVNLPAVSGTAANRNRLQLERRVGEILPSLGPEDQVYVVTIQDPLVHLKRDPLATLSRDFRVGVLISIGYASAPNWRSDFARGVEEAWAKGGKVWVSKRVLSLRPKAEWDWVEGDEKSVLWADLPSFFAAFELGQDLGDQDGFITLVRTPRNEHLFQPLVAPSKTKRRDKVAGRFEI